MTRYEKGNRNPKDDRTSEIAKILDINKKHFVFSQNVFIYS